MKKVLIFLCILLSISAYTQNCAEKIKAAKSSKAAGNYRLALSQFSAAASDCGLEKSAEIQREILGIYDKIDGLKRQADDAKVDALQNLTIAKNATEAAITAEKKATAVLDKIYFYKGRFGLAYDQPSNLYGFIDKNLKTKIAFKYTEALPFQYMGFAKVKRDNQYFLIDTLGSEYPLATELDQLSPEITALDLRLKRLARIPDAVKKSVHLKILLLGNNQLTSVVGLENLTNLIELDLFNNQLTSVAGLEKLTNLIELDLRYMKLPKKEITALRNALSTRRIFVSEKLLTN